MIEKALKAVDEYSPEHRDLGALTLALSKENFDEFRKRVSQFRREMNALFSGDELARQVYQLNFQIFPLLKIEEEQNK